MDRHKPGPPDPRSRVCNPYTHKKGKVLRGESLVNQVMLQIVVSKVGWWVKTHSCGLNHYHF